MKRISAWFVCAVLALSLGACGSDDTGNNVVPDPEQARVLVEQGNTALAAGDYVTANARYEAALAKDGNNTQARFGAAVTDVYLLQNDSELAGIRDFIEGVPVPAARRAGSAAPVSPLASRLGLDPVLTAGGSPERLGRAMFRMFGLVQTDPIAISDIQRAIKLKVLPELQEAENHLNVIEQSAGFVFLLPPAVTELPDTVEIDLGDVLLLDSVINGVQGWLGMLVAYNVDVENTDFEHVNPESLLAAGTDWATLHDDGSTQLAACLANFLAVGTRLAQAEIAISGETDDQSDDVVPQEWLGTQEYAELESGVAQVAATLTGPVATSVTDYRGDPFALQVYLGRFFSPAIDDLKTMLPLHTFDEFGEPQPTLPITFPFPTINGIFPDMTNERWQEVTGLVPPSLARR